MPGPIRIAVGTAIIALASLGGQFARPLGGDSGSGVWAAAPSSSPVTSPVDTSGWLAFTSARHGFSLRYPLDWIARQATAPWMYGDPVDHDLPNDRATDELDGPVDGVFWLASQAIPAAAASADPGIATEPTCWPPIAQWPEVRLADTVAHYHGGPDCGFWETQIVDGGRLYAFASTDSVPLDLYLAVMSTITLDPAAADDTPVSTPVPSVPVPSPGPTGFTTARPST
jgi:hypothetical protein